MKRSTALILFLFFDLFAIAAIYFFIYQPLNDIFTGIARQAEIIRQNSLFYLAFGSLCLPTIHVVGFIETFSPRYFNKSICSKIIIGSLIIPVIIGLGTSKWIGKEILRSGYIHCESADVHSKLLQIKVYVLKEDTCRELIMEKKNRRY